MTTKPDAVLRRPQPLIRAALIGARAYRRTRDLPGAVAGLLGRDEAGIVPELRRREARHEEERLARAAGYRPARHCQVLAALIAECRAAGLDLA